MNKYQIGQKLIRLDTKIPMFVIVNDIWHIPSMRDPTYIFEDGGGIGESYLCTLEELKLIHKEIESICVGRSDHLTKILQDNQIFTKLFNIENFLCDLGEL